MAVVIELTATKCSHPSIRGCAVVTEFYVASHSRVIFGSRDQGSRRDMNEEERLLRLFVVVPKSLSEAELREHFVQFGDIDYVSIVRDRNTRDSKGFAYVKYHR